MLTSVFVYSLSQKGFELKIAQAVKKFLPISGIVWAHELPSVLFPVVLAFCLYADRECQVPTRSQSPQTVFTVGTENGMCSLCWNYGPGKKVPIFMSQTVDSSTFHHPEMSWFLHSFKPSGPPWWSVHCAHHRQTQKIGEFQEQRDLKGISIHNPSSLYLTYWWLWVIYVIHSLLRSLLFTHMRN